MSDRMNQHRERNGAVFNRRANLIAIMEQRRYSILSAIPNRGFDVTKRPSSCSRILQCFLASLLSVSTARAQDLSAIPDTDVREAADQVLAILEDLTSYTCTVEYIGVTTLGVGENKMTSDYLGRAQTKFKRPNLGRRRSEFPIHPTPWIVGEVREACYDGTYWWDYVEPSPGKREMLENRKSKGFPEGVDRDDIVEMNSAPLLFRYTLSVFTDAGLNIDGREVDVLLEPFFDSDLSTLEILREDERGWVFKAIPSIDFPSSKRYESIELSISKTDGILRKKYYDGGPQDQRTISISDVVSNPDLDAADFRFAPPPDCQIVMHKTAQKVEWIRRHRVGWPGLRRNWTTD